jgi:drug/metabolite transporter (DMT)-like permease
MNAVSDAPSVVSVPTSARSVATALLIGSGLALALVVALAKAALHAGLRPVDVAAACSAGAALCLAPLGLRAAAAQIGRVGWLRGCAALALVSYALPNIAQAWVAGHVGAGHASMMLALTPLLTLAFAAALRVEPLRRDALVGLLLGLAGTWLLIAPAARAAGPGHVGTLLCGLVIPAANAAGNLIRARLLPPGGPVAGTAWAVLLIAAAVLVPWALCDGVVQRLSGAGLASLAAAAAATAAFNLLLFRLQTVAGPVRLSQVGYVAALSGVALSALLFGEPLRWNVALAALLIVTGVRRVGRPGAR